MGFHEILIPAVISAGSVFVGIWIGSRLSDRKENTLKKEELKKIRYLLNADFSLIQRTLRNGKDVHTKWYNSIVVNNESYFYLSDEKSLMDLFVSTTIKTGLFTYWNALTSSGSFIKLEADELRIINVSHDNITKSRNMQLEQMDDMRNEILKTVVKDLSTQEKSRIAQNHYKLYFKSLFETYHAIQNQLDILKNNIDWINLETEPIEKFRNNAPNMKVDSKGTYWTE